MSFQVLVVPEDPTYNGAILKPLVERILRECGKPNARVTVLSDPKVGGYEDAKGKLPKIVREYQDMDVVFFLPDADGRGPALVVSLSELEREAETIGVHLVCCPAVQEVEIWLLAGHVEKLGRRWSEVRAERSLKENVFRSFMEEYGSARDDDEGRERLMKATLKNYAGLKRRCPELQDLEDRVRAILR